MIIRRKLLIPLAVSFAIAAGIAVAIIVVTTSDTKGANPNNPNDSNRVGLLDPSRDILQICVADLAAPSNVAGTIASIDSAVTQLQNNANWSAFYDSTPHEVTGCPPDVQYPPMQAQGDLLDPASSVGHRRVDKPGPFRLVVFVISDAEATARFADKPYARSAYEGICQGDNCAEVTSALYLREGSATDTSVLSDALAKGLGLERPAEQHAMPVPPTLVPATATP